MLDGVNDQDAQAHEFVALVRRFGAMVGANSIIPFIRFSVRPEGILAPRIAAFARVLSEGIVTTWMTRRRHRCGSVSPAGDGGTEPA